MVARLKKRIIKEKPFSIHNFIKNMKEYKKFTADEPTPLMPENHEQAISEIPRETEVVEIFKQIIGAGPLPSRR